MKILPRDQKSLDQKSGFHEVAAIVVFAEIGDGLARCAVEKMRPDAMETIRLAQKTRDFEQTFRALLARDEMPFGPRNQSHYPEAGCAHRHEVFIAGQNFDGHAGVGMRGLPIISEAAFLNHV